MKMSKRVSQAAKKSDSTYFLRNEEDMCGDKVVLSQSYGFQTLEEIDALFSQHPIPPYVQIYFAANYGSNSLYPKWKFVLGYWKSKGPYQFPSQ